MTLKKWGESPMTLKKVWSLPKTEGVMYLIFKGDSRYLGIVKSGNPGREPSV